MRVATIMIACLLACGGEEEEATSATEGETPATEGETPGEPAAPAVQAQVCTGANHTCVMRASGEVYCAGRNLDGELGDGTGMTRWSWVPVQGVSGARELACGAAHTCARTESNVMCWGNNARGELGAGNTNVTHSAVAVSGLGGVAEITAGHGFSCARLESGAVRCWGRGDRGQLGNGSRDDANAPVEVSGLGDAAEISAGYGHVCARKNDGSVACWGAGTSKQLGQGETSGNSNAPAAVAGLTGVTHVAVGGNHSCAVTAEGVKCWGQNGYGQSGGEAGTNQGTPVTIEGLTGVTQLALGTNRTCALVAEGKARCWGYNNYTAQLLGVGSEEEKLLVPTEVTGVSGLQRFDSSSNHVCGVDGSNALVCWGVAADGRLGNGEARSLHEAAAVVPDVNALEAEASEVASFPAAEGELQPRTEFSVGSHHVCGVRTDGHVVCFGEGGSGRLGTGSTRANPASNAAPVAGIEDAVQVSTGQGRTCALRRNGTLACWGNLGSKMQTSLPIPIEGVSDAIRVSVGGTAHAMTACAIHADHGVSCFGRLFGGDHELHMTPERMEGLADVTDVAIGTDAACALREDGKVLCWGSGGYGQLGNGADDRSAEPVEVSGISDATAIGGGGYNYCALRRNGSVKCWGSGDDGQLTNGQTGREANSNTPVAIRGLRGVASLGAFGDSMCAALRNGSGRCWGANDFGQSGHDEADTDDVTTPWEYLRDQNGVDELGDIVQMGCGWNFCCALHAEGAVSCAGSTPIGGSGGFLGVANRRSTTPIPATGVTFALTPADPT